MKLLIITQKVNIDDPILGFFHRWIIEFSKHYQSVVVVCLEKGRYDLPDNVKVLSLGKSAQGWSVVDGERFLLKTKAVLRFYRHIFQERENYDAVFVHMNQEYILLAGLWWRLMRKRVYLWRNHHAGSWLTGLASFFCTKIFCTSKYSYTAKYKKTVLMPVGIDTEFFKPDSTITKIPNSILFLGRISPVKKPHLLIEALKILNEKEISFVANFYGDPLDVNKVYYQKLKQSVVESGLEELVKFYSGIPNYETPKIYNQHEIFVNLSSSGMYDKTIFEAMACGIMTVSSNDNLYGLIDNILVIKEDNIKELTGRLDLVLSLSDEKKYMMTNNLRQFVIDTQDIKKLLHCLVEEIKI